MTIGFKLSKVMCLLLLLMLASLTSSIFDRVFYTRLIVISEQG